MYGSLATRPHRPDHRGLAPATVPRWEWRSISRQLPVDPARLTGGLIGPMHHAADTYVLAQTSPHSVKVRDDALEVKRLLAVEALGLELWRPTLRLQFPLLVDDLDELWAAWGIRPARPLRATLTFHDFIRDIVSGDDLLTRIDVIKHRTKLMIGGCPGERVSMLVRDTHWESLAFEHEDPTLVVSALRTLGLDPRSNSSYPTGLRRITGLPVPAYDATKGAR
ncbi:MAG TPA: hypothetical protein VFI39_06045 [Gemmatimonadales bacterium]|nr:hypothetical protein [Gemmatimonadales bacterium]